MSKYMKTKLKRLERKRKSDERAAQGSKKPKKTCAERQRECRARRRILYDEGIQKLEMSDDDFEVEYLEEDEDIVQNCLETLQEPPEPEVKPPKKYGGERVASPNPLLVERSKNKSKASKSKGSKRNQSQRTHDEDSDYEPQVEEEDSDYDPEARPKRSKRQRKPTIKYTGEYHKPYSVFIREPILNEPPERSPRNVFSIKHSAKTTHTKKPQMLPNKHSQQTKVRNTIVAQQERKKPTSPGTFGKTPPATKSLFSPTLRNLLLGVNSASPPRRHEPKSETKTGIQLPKVLPHSFKLFINDIYLCDYDDPKCIEGKALSDYEKKEEWNEMCRERSELYESEKATAALTTHCLRKEYDGKGNVVRIRVDTQSKGQTDTFQAVLPSFVTPDIEVKFDANAKNRPAERHTSTMILTKEIQKDDEYLVAFSSTDFRSTTFKLEENGEIKGKKVKKYLKMLMSCKMCAGCYQYSWRGNKEQKVGGDLSCSTCKANFTSAYNLLAHVRSHRLNNLDKYKQNKVLAKIMKYHYSCRLCRYRAISIQDLRRHLLLHRSVQKFKCEVGQHLTY